MASRPTDQALAQFRLGEVQALPATAGGKRVPGAAAAASAAAAAKRARSLKEGVPSKEAPTQVPEAQEQTTGQAAGETAAGVEVESDAGAEEEAAAATLEAQVEGEQVPSSIPSTKLAWLGVSIPEEHRDATEFEDTEMALQMLLLEMTDEERPDGALDVPEKPVRVDKSAGKQGPHFFAFDKPSTVMIILGESDGKLFVDVGENEAEFKMFHAREVRDTSAHSLFAAAGFWMELYTKKSEMIRTKEQGARLVKEQLQVMVSKSKWPRANGAPDRSRLLLQAALYPHENATDKKLPVQIYIHQPDIDHPFNYRVQSDAFPGLCGYCHQPKDTKECICEKNKLIKNYEKKAREGGKLKANERAQRNKQLAQAGKDKSSVMAAKLARIRERKAQARVPGASAPQAGAAGPSGVGSEMVVVEGSDLR